MQVTKETVVAAVIQCLPYIGFPPAIKALKIIKEASAVSPANNPYPLQNYCRPGTIDAYNAYLKEEIEASMSLEPGVLTLYATADKKQPNKITT